MYYKTKYDKLDNLNTNNPKEFWDHLNKLGPKKFKQIPEEISVDNEIVTDKSKVLHHWKNTLDKLYQKPHHVKQYYDNEFYKKTLSNLKYLEESFSIDAQGSLNNPVTLDETKYALQKLKDRKATGYDEIKNEIIKNLKLTKAVHNLFVKCFETGLVPTKWRTGIISPIPKII